MRTKATFICAVAAFLLSACNSANVKESIPLPEHPRPDFERTAWVNLNGHWAFTFDEAAAQAQTKEEQGTEERFIEPALEPEEIRRMFQPKVLTNAIRFTPEGETPVNSIDDDDNILVKVPLL